MQTGQYSRKWPSQHFGSATRLGHQCTSMQSWASSAISVLYTSTRIPKSFGTFAPESAQLTSCVQDCSPVCNFRCISHSQSSDAGPRLLSIQNCRMYRRWAWLQCQFGLLHQPLQLSPIGSRELNGGLTNANKSDTTDCAPSPEKPIEKV